MEDTVSNQIATPVHNQAPITPKAIGLYGLPASGKTSLFNKLSQDDALKEHFIFFEGSEVISRVMKSDMQAFKALSPGEKSNVRSEAIKRIKSECAGKNKTAFVTGHFSFSFQGGDQTEVAWTEADAHIFTHIIYLDIPGELLRDRILKDATRSDRQPLSATHLDAWQHFEQTGLRERCYTNHILMSKIPGYLESTFDNIESLLNTFNRQTESTNRDLAQTLVQKIIENFPSSMDSVLVIDGDKTLASEDTGDMLCTRAFPQDKQSPLKRIFDNGYSFAAFQQVAFLYETLSYDQDFEELCNSVADGVTMHSEFVDLLQQIVDSAGTKPIVVTCGLRLIWERVLDKAGLADKVRVIGSGRLSDGLIVTEDTKAHVVEALQQGGYYVWAFGDSPLDLPMLRQADQAIVVVGDESIRSKSMDAELEKTIDKKGLQARQVLLPANVPARLDTTRLPITTLQDLEVTQALTGRLIHHHARDRPAAKLLATATRNASIFGPALREAHRQVGQYLALEFIAKEIGVEHYPIPHVQGNSTSGFRLAKEQRTRIIPLMRGGEPLAFGVSDIFPHAPFLHIKEADEIKKEDLEGMLNVILVDGVVNSGESIAKFVKHIRSLRPTINILIVGGVTQEDAEDYLARELEGCGKVTLVSLRTSENKYKGQGGTDTGDRLFSTVEMEEKRLAKKRS